MKKMHKVFSEMQGFSKLFLDFIEGNELIQRRFPNNHSLADIDYLNRKASSFRFRSKAADWINESMQNQIFSKKQIENFDKIYRSNSLFVCTGQQPGFLGGALYNSYKLASAVKLADSLSRRHSEMQFVPLFWIEDNDHDTRESGIGSLLGATGEIEEFDLYSSQIDNVSVSEINFGDELDELLTRLEKSLPYSEHKALAMNLMNEVYTKGKSWSDAFLELYNKLFAESGVLFVKASNVRKSGEFGQIAANLLESNEYIDSLSDSFATAEKDLQSMGYSHSLVKPGKIHFALHKGSKRHSIREKDSVYRAGDDDYTIEQLKEIATAEPERFSPRVLLRPIFQELLFPSAAVVLGPGEIAYTAQLKEAYQYFGIEIPAVVHRASATIVNHKTENLLNSEGRTLDFLFETNQTIEKTLAEELLALEDSSELVSAKELIKTAFSRYETVLSKADKSLARTVETASAKTYDLLDNLEKKLISSHKRNNSEKLQKYLKVKNFIYPRDKYQERYFSPLMFINLFGIEKFTQIIFEIADKQKSVHNFYFE